MAMDVTLRQLRAYVAVLESASFSEAAKAMHLSQAALSGLIKELENRVGVRLLDRTTRKVSASAVGETFAPMARRVLSSLDEALDNLTNLKELRRGLAAEVGEWAEGSCDGGRWIATTHEHLLVAIRFALLLHRMDQAEHDRDVVDAHAVAEQVERIRTALRRVSTVKRHATSIRGSADAIQEEIEQLNFDVRSALCAIEEQLGAARPE